MKKSIIILAYLVLAVLTSCQKELVVPITGDNSAVVESYIKAGDSTILVYLSKILPFSDDTTNIKTMIPGIKIYINGSQLVEVDTGIYKLQLVNQKIKAGNTYNLKLDYAGNTLTSQTTIPEAPVDFAISTSYIYTDRITAGSMGHPSMIDPIELSWSNTDNSYYYLIMNYLEDTPDYVNGNMAGSNFQFMQSASPTQENTYRIDQHELNCFGTYQLILFKVNPEFNDVFTLNGSNSNNLVNPITNITNGFGVFTGMNSDTLYLEVIPN